MKIIKTIVLLIFSLHGLLLNGQDAPVKMMDSSSDVIPETVELQAPKDVIASDGIYDKFVLVRWENSDHASTYKVFRSTDPKKSALQEVTRSWQRSTWLCDYTALPGVKYHYAVVANSGRVISPTSNFDQGHVRSRPVANEEEDNLAVNEAYAAPHFVYLLASGITATPMTLRAGESFILEANLQNIFERATSRTEIRTFFSDDAQLDWGDQLLGRRNLSSVRPNSSLSLKENLTLPTDVLPGEYYIILVCSAEGKILHSKTDSTTIQIVR